MMDRIRAEFPILNQTVHGKPLVYLDNAATTQKPNAVIQTLKTYYERDNSNIHRGVHQLSERATRAFEAARGKVRAFLNAAADREVIFTRGTTESINLVAQSFARPRLKAGDEILITGMEHHSNIVPWQMVCEQTGAKLRVARLTDDGRVDLADFRAKLGSRTRLAAFTQVSNALGTVNPVGEMIALSRAAGAATLIDGAQAVAHAKVDVRAMDCDFYAFSSHKIYGPTGVGVLYGRERLLEAMPPYQGGGDMILSVTFEKTTYAELPHKFEAGTPNIAGVIGLGAALDFVSGIGLDAIARHESALLKNATARLAAIPGLKILGPSLGQADAHEPKAAVISFTLEGIHPHDIGTIVDREGVAIRTGHHCAQPVMERFGVPATARASFAIYNSTSDIDRLAAAILITQEVFRG